VDLAVDDAFLVSTAGIGGDHAAPELHRRCIQQVLGDQPLAGETIEQQPHRLGANTAPTPLPRDKELGH